MNKPRHETNTICWEPGQVVDDVPVERPVSLSVCTRCAAGDCELCVRSACHHRCGPVRKHGVCVPVAGLTHDPKGGL